MGQGKDEVDATPAGLRRAIAETRSDLGEHLRSLNISPLPDAGDDPGEIKMPTAKKATSQKLAPGTTTKRASAKSTPKNLETKLSPKAASTKSTAKASAEKAPVRRKRPATKSNGIAAEAGHVIDTMAAAAVVGAVKGAARTIAEDEAKSLKSRSKPSSKSTGDVLAKMAPGAAMGAVVGAARSVVPVDETPSKNPKAAKR